jgi:hypothetical protein
MHRARGLRGKRVIRNKTGPVQPAQPQDDAILAPRPRQPRNVTKTGTRPADVLERSRYVCLSRDHRQMQCDLPQELVRVELDYGFQPTMMYSLELKK